MDSLKQRFKIRHAVGRIQSIDPEDFFRAVQHSVAAGIPRPTTRTSEPLCLGEISLTPPKCVLGTSSFSHIDRCSEQFIDISLFIHDGTADTFNVFEGAVRQHDSVFEQTLLLVTKNLRGALSYPVTIVRVYPLQEHLKGRYAAPRIHSIDPENLLRAVQQPILSWIPRPAARMGQLLCCGQVGFAPTQHRFCAVPVDTVTDRGECPQPIAAPEGSEADFYRELVSIFAQSVQLPAG